MEIPLAGIDVVEVAPPYDHAEVTAFLAIRVVLEALSGIAWRRKNAASAEPGGGHAPDARALRPRARARLTGPDRRTLSSWSDKRSPAAGSNSSGSIVGECWT